MPDVDPKWHASQVRQYAGKRGRSGGEQERYRKYATALGDILRKACELHAPGGIVETREKSLASFAEKAARKADKYDHPVRQLTDLAGARVIVSTQDQVRAICRFIREHFTVDEANSLDASGRLADDRFGYRSVHFVLQLHERATLGVAVPLKYIGARKAEIQVRTFLQHAWAAITHDRLYKSEFTPPAQLKRLAHRQAALIEDADEALNHFEDEMQAFLGSYAAYLRPDKLEQEIGIVRLLLKSERKAKSKRGPRRIPTIALRLARLLRAKGMLDEVIKTLEPFTHTPGPARLPICVELGTALLERNRGTDRAEGIGLLQELVGSVDSSGVQDRPIAERKLLATALAALAAAGGEVRHKLYTAALQLDPDDPYILCSQLAYNLNETNQPAILDSARPAMLRAIDTCGAHVAAGVQLPQAWFTMARLHLLLGHTSAALDHYSKAIRFHVAPDGPAWAQQDFDGELEFLKRVQGRDPLPAFAWSMLLLRMGRWLTRTPRPNIQKHVGQAVSFKGFTPGRRVLVVAGGTRADLEARMRGYEAVLRGALDGFAGVVVSGGTNVGIPGLVGRVAAMLKRKGRKTFDLVGYHPEFARVDFGKSEHYDHHVRSGEVEAHGLGEPLRMWLDILAAGVDPSDVRLLGINGGDVSRFEYALALAMGATVGLIESSERSADLVLGDPDWSKLTSLLPLPNDPMTAQAFAQAGATDLNAAELRRMGEVVHTTYLRLTGTTPNHRKPNTLPWVALPEEYRLSSCEQAAYAFHTLRRFGFRITRVGSVPTNPPIPGRLIEPLAEIEHGRWNHERLRLGWRYATTKNDDARLSPYLVSWTRVPEGIRNYDRGAVRALPEVFAAGRYKLRPPAR
jgi:ppGpp synthetase/RelA/SpoT-type nucleotidyltranferase